MAVVFGKCGCEYLQHCNREGVAMQLNKTIRVTFKGACGQVKEESIEWFVEDQAFSPSNGLAPSPLTSSPSSKLDWRHRKTEKLKPVGAGKGVGAGEEPNHTMRESCSSTII